MDVVALEMQLHLPQCHSLKEKRAVIKPILEGARRRYQVAAAEVAYQDKWQRSALGFSAVSGDGSGHAAVVLDRVERFVWSFPEIEVLDSGRRWIDA
ncbi:MAG: uncharacterized protein QOG64_2603 [Acidimicrobiaceae bacterium]|nr:uncharacterized protein [Acidimicrobiaceae bacterium]